MASPSHRNSASMSTTNLLPPGAAPQQQRRMSLPPPPSPLNLPEPVYGNRRPPSPLRNGFAIDPRTGEFNDGSSLNHSEESGNGRQWGPRPVSPSPSVGKFAANFAQRVGSLVSNMSARSGLPTDEELEAEAEREREQSRREAERILAREADERERRTVEERVMAMLHSDPDTLRPPPSRAQTMPVNPPSPSSSQKEGSWWSMAKQRLTPTKEPLTPAQQVIQETKAREKEMEKEKKKSGKLEKKQRSKDWPSTPEGKYEDPAFIRQGLAAPPARPVSAAPSSPSPLPRGLISTPSSLAASPMRGLESDVEGGASPSRAQHPLYAQFNPQGALDVPGTLLTIAKRFEKLEKWTVSHVRALEERMDDVERWLVEKERDKDETNGNSAEGALVEIREEMAELQGRIGELGREMAKMATSPGNLSSGPSRGAPTLGRAPSTSSSIAVQSISRALTSPPRATPPKTHTATSPTTTTPVPSNRGSSRTRLPYPTGDYTSPPNSGFLGQSPFSPTNSPPASLTSATKGRMSISGLPSQDLDAFSSATSPSGFPETKSANGDNQSPRGLPLPNPPAWRPSSASPTPRKRYTVALGAQIMPRERSDRDDPPPPQAQRPMTPHSRSQSRDLGTAFFSSSPVSASSALDDPPSGHSADESDGVNEETIGRTSGRHVGGTLAPPSNPASPSSSPNGGGGGGGGGGRRARPQSMYAPITSQALAAPSPVTPLNVNVRLRSRSTDRFGLGLSDAGTGAPIPPQTPSTGKFVDPLVVRRQTKEATQVQPKPLVGKQKVAVGDLVAFFDQEKQ